MSNPTLVAVVLAVLTVAIQIYMVTWMLERVRAGAQPSKLDTKAHARTSLLSLASFFLFAFLPALFGRHDALRFIENLPFKPFHALVRRYLGVPAGRADLKAIYQSIWMVLAFVLPCLFFIAINTTITMAIWERLRFKRP